MSESKIGIWWFVNGDIISKSVPHEAVEPVNGWKDAQVGHFDYWRKLRKNRPFLAGSEYTDFLRGRVLLRVCDQCFVVYGGRDFMRLVWLHRRIIQAFGLENQKITIAHDAHYDKATPLLENF